MQALNCHCGKKRRFLVVNHRWNRLKRYNYQPREYFLCSLLLFFLFFWQVTAQFPRQMATENGRRFKTFNCMESLCSLYILVTVLTPENAKYEDYCCRIPFYFLPLSCSYPSFLLSFFSLFIFPFLLQLTSNLHTYKSISQGCHYSLPLIPYTVMPFYLFQPSPCSDHGNIFFASPHPFVVHFAVIARICNCEMSVNESRMFFFLV